jgi:hypothetical protein
MKFTPSVSQPAYWEGPRPQAWASAASRTAHTTKSTPWFLVLLALGRNSREASLELG